MDKGGTISESIRTQVAIPKPPREAFQLFTERLGEWWPPQYTWSQDALEELGIEPRVGGFCYERGPHGFRCDWGRVIAWEPPTRLAFRWQISQRREPVPDPNKASVVEVTCRVWDDGMRCRVQLEHREFGRHGAGADEYRKALASDQGWPFILEQYVNAAA